METINTTRSGEQFKTNTPIKRNWIWQTYPDRWARGVKNLMNSGPGWTFQPLYSQILNRADDGRFVCSGGRGGVWLGVDGQCACNQSLIAGEPCDHMMWLRRAIEGYEPQGFRWEHSSKWNKEVVKADWQNNIEEGVEILLGAGEIAEALQSWVVSHPLLSVEMGRRIMSCTRPAVKHALLRITKMIQGPEIRQMALEEIEKADYEYIWIWQQVIGGGGPGQTSPLVEWASRLETERGTRLLIHLTGFSQEQNIAVSKEALKRLLGHPEREVRQWAIGHLIPVV